MPAVASDDIAVGHQAAFWRASTSRVVSQIGSTTGRGVIADRLAGLVRYLWDVSGVNTYVDDNGSDRCPHSFGGGHHIVRRVYRDAVGTKCSGHSRERRPGE